MKAFISSTSKDLGEYRRAAYEVCNRLSIVPIGMEQFESMGVGATAGSTHKLNDADVYVGIIANRYGYIEDGYDKSVTELEFDHAGTRGIERLCFVADSGARLRIYPEDVDKLTEFKARIDKLVRSTFRSPWEFKYKLYDSVLKWLFRLRGEGPLLRHVFEPIFADYTRFGGRVDVLNRVRTFIDTPEPGYFVITAPAGYGKTALAVKLIELNRSITAYHFFTTLYGSDPASEFLSEQFFLRNVVEQMRLWQFHPNAMWEAPTTLSGWVSAYQTLLATPLPEKRVLVIDGLDEVKAWKLRPYLTIEPPANLKIIVTLRDVGQPWADEYGFPRTKTQQVSLAGLTREDVREVLQAAGLVAGAFANEPALLDKVVHVTSPEQTVAGADPLYVTSLAADIESRRVTAANIGLQPRRLEDYLQRWWQEIVAESEKDSSVLDLLGTLAASVGPMRHDDLIAINPSLKPSWTLDPIQKALANIRRTVAGNDTTGYSFAHPRFRDYLRRYPEVATFETKLVEYCKRWREHKGRYALRYGVQHLANQGMHDHLFATVLDDKFQASQREAFGSIHPTLTDLARATAIACDGDRFLDLLRCVTTYRGLSEVEGLTQAVFRDVTRGDFDAAAKKVVEHGFGVKTSSTWVVVLRCYLVWTAVQAGKHDAAAQLVEVFGRQFGLSYHGASSYGCDLCETLIADALDKAPSLARDIGVDPDWAPVFLSQRRPALATHEVERQLRELDDRLKSLEAALGENQNVSLVEFIDEELAGEFVTTLRDALIAVSREDTGRMMVDRALAAVDQNPYPRYRDNALVAIGVAALAVPDAAWSAARLQSILKTGLEKEGVTFTFDLPAQLVAETARRGLPTEGLAEYLEKATGTHDRWGTRLRSMSAQACAEFVQGRTMEAREKLEFAGRLDHGFAGYMSAHMLSLASRWCELGVPARVNELGLVARSRSHADRVRDSKFAAERKELIERFEQWLTASTPEWEDVLALLRAASDPDARRAYEDLVSARWSAEGRWPHWSHLVQAALNDATALDFVLARLTARAIRMHHAALRDLSDATLNEAIRLCAERLATSRPWEMFGLFVRWLPPAVVPSRTP